LPRQLLPGEEEDYDSGAPGRACTRALILHQYSKLIHQSTTVDKLHGLADKAGEFLARVASARASAQSSASWWCASLLTFGYPKHVSARKSARNPNGRCHDLFLQCLAGLRSRRL